VADSPRVEDNSPSGPDRHIIDIAFRRSRIDELEHLLRGIVPVDEVTLGPGSEQIKGELGLYRLGDVHVSRARFGGDLTIGINPDQSNDQIGFAMAVRGAGAIMSGQTELPVTTQKGIVVDITDHRLVNCYDEESDITTLVLSRSRLEEHCAKLLGHDLYRPPQVQPAVLV